MWFLTVWMCPLVQAEHVFSREFLTLGALRARALRLHPCARRGPASCSAGPSLLCVRLTLDHCVCPAHLLRCGAQALTAALGEGPDLWDLGSFVGISDETLVHV